MSALFLTFLTATFSTSYSSVHSVSKRCETETIYIMLYKDLLLMNMTQVVPPFNLSKRFSPAALHVAGPGSLSTMPLDSCLCCWEMTTLSPPLLSCSLSRASTTTRSWSARWALPHNHHYPYTHTRTKHRITNGQTQSCIQFHSLHWENLFCMITLQDGSKQ